MIVKEFDLTMRVNVSKTVTKPISVLQIDNRYWIDLQGVLEALHLSWPRWSMYFRGCADKFGLLRHEDATLMGTLLVLPERVPSIALHLYALPEMAGRWTVRARINGMHESWGQTWSTTKFQHLTDDDMLPRKVNAALVRALHADLAAGAKIDDAAARLGIAAKTARRIKNGSFPLDKLAGAEWFKTFGGANAAKTRRTGVSSDF